MPAFSTIRMTVRSGARAMEDEARYHESLALAKLDRLVFQIDQELALDYEEELALCVVLVPVVPSNSSTKWP
jgi:hypothetical protein